MSVDRISRRRSDTDDESSSKKKRVLFDKGTVESEPPSDDLSTKLRRGFLRKEQSPNVHDEAPRPDESIVVSHVPESASETYTRSSASRASSRRTADSGRRPFDELSMAVKVRNRTESDPRPPTSDESRRHRDSPMAHDLQNPDSYGGSAAVPAELSDEAQKENTEDEWRGGTWVDSGYSATDEEAHRDKVYTPPNFLVQMLIVMFAQMKLYAKGRATIVLIVMIALIPILMVLLPSYLDLLATNMGATVSNSYTGFLLALLPIVMALFTAKQCGTQIPNEFKDRTAYMSIPLPMHRLSFYFGKYLAGFLYCLALFLLAFGVAVACTATKFDSFYIDVLLQAFVGTIVAILVYSSTAFCIGCFLRRGSVLLPLVLNLVILPAVFFYPMIEFDATSLLLAPVFLPDAIVQSLGFPISASAIGMISAIMSSAMPTVGFGDLWTMCGLGLIWGAAFLVLGAFRMMRREM